MTKICFFFQKKNSALKSKEIIDLHTRGLWQEPGNPLKPQIGHPLQRPDHSTHLHQTSKKIKCLFGLARQHNKDSLQVFGVTIRTGKKELMAIFMASAVVSQTVERKKP